MNKRKTAMLVVLALAMLGGAGFAADDEPHAGSNEFRASVLAEWDRHYAEMQEIIARDGFLYKPKDLSWLKKDPDLAARGIGNDDKAHALDLQAFYHKADKDPLAIVLRRTKALLGYLTTMPGWKGNSGDYQEQLASIERQTAAASDPGARKDLYRQVCALRRRLAFSNPLLNFDKLLVGSRADYRNCVDLNWMAGKGVWVVQDPFGAAPKVENIFAGKTIARGRYAGKLLAPPATGPLLQAGAFSSLELSFDGKKILFAWSPMLPHGIYLRSHPSAIWDSDGVWHLFEANVDGSNCVQLTDGPFADMDPCYLPSGRIAFTSFRRSPDKTSMLLRCGHQYPAVYTLHSCAADGSDIVTMSYHDLPEYSPSVDSDGKIVFTRWEYYDKASHWTGNLWTTYPDGRDPRAPHGNYPFPHQTFDRTLPNGKGLGVGNPFMEQGIRAVPGFPGLYTATASTIHGGERGSLVLINLKKEDDFGMGQVSRLTPELFFPESECNSMSYGLGDADTCEPFGVGSDKVYGYCWPLHRDFYLCAYGPDIFYLDRFGNRELIVARCEVPGAAGGLCDPIPLRPRLKPPEIPVQTYEGARHAMPHPPATIKIMNIYDADLPWPPEVAAGLKKIKWLRVLQFFPKNEDDQGPFYTHGHGAMGYAANAGYDNGVNNCRMPLGIVPVDDDGSAYFFAPIHKDIYFQALDENGMAVQSMRSATHVQAGEQLTCQGCHENKWRAPRLTRRPTAFTREPSLLKPEVSDGDIPFNYHRLVKPVFDNTCQPCHVKEAGQNAKTGPKNMDYAALRPYAFWFEASRAVGGVACAGSRTIPGHFGALASKMGQALLSPTHQAARKAGVISDEDFRRVVLWLDCNSAQFGTVFSKKQVAAQTRGEEVFPMVDFQPWNPLGLEIYREDKTPPPAVSSLRATSPSNGQVRIELSWEPVIDRESGTGCYVIYRDGKRFTWAMTPAFADHDTLQGETHVYEVAAIDRNGNEGPKSSSVSAICDWNAATPHLLEWDPDNMKATVSSDYRNSCNNMLNGGGLSDDGERHTNQGHWWLSKKGEVSGAWLQFDLGRVLPLAGLRIWNLNQQAIAASSFFKGTPPLGAPGDLSTKCGIKQAELQFSADGTTWNSLPESLVFPEADGMDTYKGFEHRFANVLSARYVKIKVISNYGGDAVGLSKVKFIYGRRQ